MNIWLNVEFNESLLREHSANYHTKVFGVQPESETAYLAAWTICKVSGHDDKNLVRAIVTYFENFACFVELMKFIITREVESMRMSFTTISNYSP